MKSGMLRMIQYRPLLIQLTNSINRMIMYLNDWKHIYYFYIYIYSYYRRDIIQEALESDSFRIGFRFLHLIVLWPGVSEFTSLSFHFLIYNAHLYALKTQRRL